MGGPRLNRDGIRATALADASDGRAGSRRSVSYRGDSSRVAPGPIP
jgi:hypothetical protein